MLTRQVRDMEQEEKNMQLFELVQALLYQSGHKPHVCGGGGDLHTNHSGGWKVLSFVQRKKLQWEERRHPD